MNSISKLIGIALTSCALAALPTLAASQSLTHISLMPETVTGGTSLTGTVVLSQKAPSGGFAITLASSDSYATVPASVTVAAGSRSAAFTVTTTSVTAKESATITGTDPNSKSAKAQLRILPAYLVFLSLNPVSVTGGTTSTATLTLSGNAPTGGLAVSLFCNVPFAQVPASVTVPAGANSATFTVTTTDVTSNGRAVLLATDANNHAAGAELKVTAPIAVQLKGLAIPQAAAISGSSATGVITLNGPAPTGGFAITLTSSETFVQVPASVTVPEGSKIVTFTITTSDVIAKSSATITGTDPNGKSATATIEVAPIKLLWVSVSQAVVEGGKSATGTIQLDGNAPTGGYTVTLASNQSALQVPTSVTVPAGSKAVTFSITTTAVTSKTRVTITATDANGKSMATEVVVRP